MNKAKVNVVCPGSIKSVGILEEVQHGTYDYKVEAGTDVDGVSWIQDTCTQIHGFFLI